MKKFAGGVLVLLLSTILIYGLFQDIINEANQVSFASSGDGVKSTFTTLYHIEHDTSYWHTNCMNYPWGESVFFTGNQVFLTNILKFLDESGIKVGDYSLGISNILILFSYVLGAFFLYLIFMELGLPVIFSLIGSILIIILTPQWDRLGGHYNLAYAYAFPVAIFLLIRFYKKPSLIITGIMGFFLFYLGGKQLYFVVLNGLLISLFFLFIFISEPQRFGGRLRIVGHYLVQFVLPLMLVSFLAASLDHIPDRTAYPWGFIQSTTRLEGVFLPIGKPYGPFIKVNGSLKTVAYVGLMGTIVMLWVLYNSFYNGIVKKDKKFWQITDKIYLDILFWAGFISLLVSLGLPFTLGLEKLLNYTGPFRQFRAIGRFIFPFYYMLNILVIYKVFNLWKNYDKKLVKVLALSALLWMSYDGWLNIRERPQKYYNKFEVLNDRENMLPVNHWVKNHEWNEYQALMPFPYFHVGSENYWIGGGSPIQNDAFFASLKTGLPLNAVQLSRTSLSETLKNLDLIWEPSLEYPILDHIQKDKPYLFMVMKGTTLSKWERNIISYGEKIDENKKFIFYKFYPSALAEMILDHQESLKKKMVNAAEKSKKDFYAFEPFNSKSNGVYTGKINHRQTFFSTEIADTGKYKVLMWMHNMDEDLWPRTRIKTNLWDEKNNKYYGVDIDVGRRIICRVGSKALYKDQFYIKKPNTRYELEYRNKVATSGNFIVDNILIVKEDAVNVLSINGRKYVNNRLLVEK